MANLSISKRLDAILQYMEPYWPWVNCHMVNFITDRHWEEFVPLALREEINNVKDHQQFIDTLFWTTNDNANQMFPESYKFIETSRNHCLQQFTEIITSKDEFEHSVLGIATETKIQYSIKEFLSEKKRHEVEITARLVNDLIKCTANDNQEIVIVDAGDGKGYLSSRLALEYGHMVLGIDSNPVNTENALERNKKLKKAWNGLVERANLESQGITPPRRGKQKLVISSKQDIGSTPTDSYKTLDAFITSDLQLSRIVEQQFPQLDGNNVGVCLTGLHTCGNLAATCLKLFHQHPQCKLLCNIGCCYHLLRESFSGPEFFGNKQISDANQEYGFPLSRHLQNKAISLGRNARMLAVQSVERTKSAKELPNISLFYRALFEVLVCEFDADLKDTIQVGKIRKFDTFEEYVELCLKKYPNLSFSPQRIMDVQSEHENKKQLLDMFYLLRMSFAPVLESIILLDRLLYLQEQGYSNSYLVPAFDAVVSPRRFAIIAIK